LRHNVDDHKNIYVHPKKKAKIWVIVVTDGIGVRQMVSEIVFIYRLHILS